MLELNFELKLTLVATSQVDGWTKAKLMLNLTQVEVVVEVGAVCFIPEVIQNFSRWVSGRSVGGWAGGGEIENIAISSFN